MQLFLPSNRIKIILISLLIVLFAGTFVYNQYLINKILEQERSSVELWAKAIEFNSQPIQEEISTKLNSAIRFLYNVPEVPDSIIAMIEDAETAKSSIDFVSQELIIPDRFNIPTIVVDESGFVTASRYLEEDRLESEELIERFGSLNDPITITIGDENFSQNQYVYYGESQTVQYLRYFPYIQFGLLALLLGLGYTTYRSITRSEQSNLWVGMAKEAAHQLGTPISSLYGWVELLKDRDNGDDEKSASIIHEIENDISRLRGVAERFNKIGSEPELTEMRIEPIIDQVISYMERRLPQLGKHVDVRKTVENNAKVKVNPELFQWAIENLIKNSMDAIRENSGDAYVSIKVHQMENELFIDIEDSGAGIDHKHISEIFKPGFSTKKRGWGLGLSLTKRIIEDYHKGSIFILRSEPETGTLVRIALNV